MGLIKPLLPARARFHQPPRLHFEGRSIEGLEGLGHPVDFLEAAVVVLEVVDHDLVPEPGGLEVANQVGVHHGEFPREVRFHVEVLIGRLDGLGHPGDVGNGRRRRNGHHVGVPHALGPDLLPHRVPVEALRFVHLQVLIAALPAEDSDGVDGENAPAPQRPFKAVVAAPLHGEIAGGLDREVADGLHGAVGEFHGFA